ncbi:MAG: hypothetical protein IKP73_20950 [Bacteroidales bacterium]|nr:hypothetical protein [Bacteroidales bacterium]
MEDTKYTPDNATPTEDTVNTTSTDTSTDTPIECTEDTAGISSDKDEEPAATASADSIRDENDKDIETYTDIIHDQYIVGMANQKVENAMMILSFMLDNGIDVKPDTIQKITNARNIVNTPEWKDVECEFYQMYNSLVKDIYPIKLSMVVNPSKINPDTLTTSILGKDRREKRKSHFVFWSSIIAIIFLIVLLTVQIFYFLGSTRLTDISTTNAELEKTMQRKREVQIILSNDANNLTYQLEFEDLEAKEDELNNKLQSNILLLEPWANKLSSFTFNTREGKPIDMQEKGYMKTNIDVIQEAKGYALILGIYIVPLLCGLVGGLVYVLSELRTDIRKLTLEKESTLKYILRLLLGGIAGFAVGLFWSDIENAQALGLTSIPISPMLVAFFAGLCVEHVLEFIQRIIKGLFDNLLAKSGKKDDDKKADAAQQNSETKTEPQSKAKTAGAQITKAKTAPCK